MAEETTPQGNIRQEYNTATVGLNLDQSVNQIKPGTLTYALNANVENFDASSVNYQNEQGNEFCVSFPEGYQLIGKYFIQEQNKHIFFLVNTSVTTGGSEIGYMINNDCVYRTLVNAPCLNFQVNSPIHKVVHKITNCTTEIYWTDGFNPRRYLDINPENIPYKLAPGSDLCDPEYTDELDCNRIKVQPNFDIPQLKITDVVVGGELKAGTVQFAIQYCDSSGNPFTSFYSVTNPTPIADPQITTNDFNYNVGKSVVVSISNLDTTGQYQYYNLAVIETVNAITSVKLVGTYFIEESVDKVTYTGQDVTAIRLSINDIFEKYPYYEIAQDLTAAQDILIWDNLSSIDRINYQAIANQISLKWQTYKIPASENYADELNATNLRGYLRDEVYAFEIVFLLSNGKQTDGFHIPGRAAVSSDRVLISSTNPDYIENGSEAERWQIYNTASLIGAATGAPIGNATPYQYGEFAYWESEEEYSCNQDIWGDLAGEPIRHHKFPDVLVSPIFESAQPTIVAGKYSVEMQTANAVFPIGVKVNEAQIEQLIQSSDLSDEEKAEIVGYKIVRGDRSTNRSIVGKGILRNVNKYTRENQDYYYPNYPYNDLSEDPFLNGSNNAYSLESEPWLVICTQSGEYQYTDPNTNKQVKAPMVTGQIYEFCSLTKPIHLSGGAEIGPANYDVWFATGDEGLTGYDIMYTTPFTTDNTASKYVVEYLDGGGFTPGDTVYRKLFLGGTMTDDCDGTFNTCTSEYYVVERIVQSLNTINNQKGRISTLNCKTQTPLPAPTADPNIRYRQVFNSPETSFGQPFLGTVLKLENVMFGAGIAHFTEVKNNAKYKLLSKEAQEDALKSSYDIASNPFNAQALFAAYQSYLTIYVNGITRKNYAYSFNSMASYDYFGKIDNDLGIKQRKIDLKQYLIPGVQSVGDDLTINNYQRESSVYIKTDDSVTPLPFPDKTPSIAPSGTSLITDKSRFTIGGENLCAIPFKDQPISVISYYASLKNIIAGQWGQIYSYTTIDTGYQRMFNDVSVSSDTVFGGDTFISRFAFKTKLPFFIDNRVGAPDDSDIFYDEIGNIAYPKYWHSARSILADAKTGVDNGKTLINFFSYKAHNFDCPNDPATIPAGSGYSTYRTYYDGYFYLFAYGIPNFYCESSYNVDLRQAYDNRAGDFWPHVSTGIPDDWVQETFVSIANDNTYTYNSTFSKQNKENTFTHLPPDWDSDNFCFTNYPFRAIYSEPQFVDSDNRVNNWLTYRAISYFDFPQNYGGLVSLDGIQNKAVLARFENKSLMYNNLLTVDTSNPQAAYLGNPNLFKGAPPIDFAETDLGYVGSQNKFLLKIPQGQITVDAKRGQIFLISGTQAADLSAFGSGMNRFFTDHLAFEILRYFPEADTDNHFNGIGLHGVYDTKFDRVIITKLDYIPLNENIEYNPALKQFFIEVEGQQVQVLLTDPDYFCNKSWTVSFNFNTKSWTSFHSYIPNFYIGENNFFYSGINGCCYDFDFVAGPIVPDPTTTTTTTVRPLECNIAGVANVVYPSTTSTSTSTTTTTIAPAQYKIRSFFTGNSIGQTTCNGEDAYTTLSAYTFQLTELDGVTPKINTTGGDIIIDVSREFIGCAGQGNIQPEILVIPNGQSETYTYYIYDVVDCGGTCISTEEIITCYVSITPSTVIPSVGYFVGQCVRINNCNSYTVTQVSTPIDGSIFTYVDCYNRTSGNELTGAIGESITFCAKTNSVFLNSGGLQLTDNGPCS